MQVNDDEFKQWLSYMKCRAARWTVDLIHDGHSGRDLLCFITDESDTTMGVYVHVHVNGLMQAGTFTGALPHIGEAMFTVKWECKFDDFDVASTKVRQRLGV